MTQNQTAHVAYKYIHEFSYFNITCTAQKTLKVAFSAYTVAKKDAKYENT